MGVPPALGREFMPSDAPGGKPAPVAVLSYLFWQRQFAGSPDVLGKTIEVDRSPYTIIGVARPRFTWGDDDVYVPGVPSGDPKDYWMSFIKLKPGVKYSSAAAELQVLVDRFTRDDPKDFRRDRKVAIVTLNEEVLGRFSGTIVLLFVAVAALLVIGCASVDWRQPRALDSPIADGVGLALPHRRRARCSGRLRLSRQALGDAPSVLVPARGSHSGKQHRACL